MLKSNWTIERIVQALVEGNKVDNVTDKDIRIFLSYAAPTTSGVTPLDNSTTPGDIVKNLNEETKTNLNHQFCSL